MLLNTVCRASCLLAIAIALPLAFAGSNAAQAPVAQPVPATTSASLSKPLWTDLTPAQKTALAPLSIEWDKMPEIRKKKWMEIINRYATMKPDEQARVQERMRDWVKLTPEQRMAARENFAKTTQLKPEQKSAHWQQYQQLSDEEKKRLATEANTKKTVTNLPSDALKNPKILAPIKVGPKPATASNAHPLAKPAAVAASVTAASPATSATIPAPAIATPAPQAPQQSLSTATPASQAVGK